MDENGTYSWPGGQNTRPKKKPDFKRVGRTVIAVIAALLVLAVALTCFYTVDDKQQAETVINDAKAYQNAQLPQAQAQADQLIQNAEYLKQKRINEAIEKVALFEAMYSEYAQNPAITRTRMYYEAISQVLPGVKLYINTGGQGGDVQMLLPLESLAGTEGGNAK